MQIVFIVVLAHQDKPGCDYPGNNSHLERGENPAFIQKQDKKIPNPNFPVPTEGIFPFICWIFLSLPAPSAQGSSTLPLLPGTLWEEGEQKLLSPGLILFHTLGITGKPWNFRHRLFRLGILYWRRAGTLSTSPGCSESSPTRPWIHPGMGHPWFLWEIWAVRDVLFILGGAEIPKTTLKEFLKKELKS